MFLAADAVLFAATAITMVAVAVRTDLRRTRALKLAHALGHNAGMTQPEVAAMYPPQPTYDRRRLVKFTFAVPAGLVGRLEVPDLRAKVEAEIRGTIRGVMGHVTVTVEPALPRRPYGLITLTRAEAVKPVPMFVAAADLR